MALCRTSGEKQHTNEFPCKGTAAENLQTAPDNKLINEAGDPAAEPPWAGGSTRATSGGKNRRKTDESGARRILVQPMVRRVFVWEKIGQSLSKGKSCESVAAT